VTNPRPRREPPLSRVSFERRLAAEALGVFLIVIFGPGAAVVSAHEGGAITLEGVAAANGIIILALIYTLGHVSGAHFNPGDTLSFALVRHFNPKEVVPYWLAQFAGGVLGAAVLLALFGDSAEAAVTFAHYSVEQAFAMEVVLTFLLMLVITAVATDSRAIGQAAAIAIGATVALDIIIGGPISGGSMNPARSLGPALVQWELSDIWIYLIAPPVGAILGALAYQAVRGDHLLEGDVDDHSTD
jgi:MIP family channel proteins